MKRWIRVSHSCSHAVLGTHDAPNSLISSKRAPGKPCQSFWWIVDSMWNGHTWPNNIAMKVGILLISAGLLHGIFKFFVIRDAARDIFNGGGVPIIDFVVLVPLISKTRFMNQTMLINPNPTMQSVAMTLSENLSFNSSRASTIHGQVVRTETRRGRLPDSK